MVFCNMNKKAEVNQGTDCHNPYFNRWFSAIQFEKIQDAVFNTSQSLF